MFADMSVFHKKGKETLLASSEYKSQDRDAANHSAMYRATSTMKNQLAPNLSKAEEDPEKESGEHCNHTVEQQEKLSFPDSTSSLNFPLN